MRRRRPVEPIVAGACALAAALAICGWGGRLRLNLTDSIPAGVYRVVGAGSGGLTRGATVLVCLPPDVAAFARSRGYVPATGVGGACAGETMPVGKALIAVAGDTVAVSASGLAVNGAAVPMSRALARDSRGRTLPHPALGIYVVGAGELWLGSRSARGFDSRYFGAVPTSTVRSRLVPLWTAPPSGERR